MIETIFLIDRSGSMADMWGDVVGGLKTYIERAREQDMRVTIGVFNSALNTPVIRVPVKDVIPEVLNLHGPSGSTALIDSGCKLIDQAGSRLALLRAEDRPDRVVFVTFTDGEENASYIYGMDNLRERVTHQTDKYGWEFLFMGANIDSFSTGQGYGIASAGTANVSFTPKGTSAVFAAAATYTTSASKGASLTSIYNSELDKTAP